jgi:hypothetical protein
MITKYCKLLNLAHTVSFTDLDQGREILNRFSLPKSMKHTVGLICCRAKVKHKRVGISGIFPWAMDGQKGVC